MTQVPPPPGSPPPPPPAPPPAQGPGDTGVTVSGPGAPPPKKGLSTGVKVAIGCGIVLLLVLILMGTCLGFLTKKVSDVGESVVESAEQHEEANRTIAELEREHPFTPPADGVLDEELVDKFWAATDDAWGRIEDWAKDLHERGERIDQSGGDAGFGDAMAAMRGLSDARLALVEALDDQDLSPAAYLWTGRALIQAGEAEAAGGTGVPERNLEIAREHRDRIAELRRGDDADEPTRGAVYALATVVLAEGWRGAGVQ
ncbi:MAG TPA: hypothetical protein VIC56_10640 [Gemmatimonadota bacterium]|jgi:hypothetical protein